MTSALVPTSTDPDTRASLAIYERLKPLKDALGIDKLTDAEIQLFAMVALHTGLDPFTKQIYAVKRDGKVNHQTGIDGYRSVAEGKGGGQYAGSDEATFEACDCGKEPAEHPRIARVVVHRILPSGHVVDQVGVARWHELYTGSSEQFMWKKMPYNQLAKCAEANGLRKAFPRVLGGVYIAEEMQGAETFEGEATEVPAKPAPPSIEDRVAQRRAQAEAAKPAEEGQFVAPQAWRQPAPQAAQAAVEEVEGTSRPLPDAEPLCGQPSPYDDEARCELPKDHGGRNHATLKPDRSPESRWPVQA